MEDLATTVDYDFVVWTADNARHNKDTDFYPRAWSEVLSETSNLISLIRGSTGSVPVFPVVGNNDVCGTTGNIVSDTCDNDQLAPGVNPVLTDITRAYSSLLSPTAQTTFQQYGYYEMTSGPSGTPLGALSILSLNTVAWMTKNLLDHSCKAGTPGLAQLDWTPGARALIIGHVPASDTVGNHKQCMSGYYNIVAQYPGVISGQLFGHLHSDEFMMQFSTADGVTRYNPAVRVFWYESTTLAIVDFDQYYVNLDDANAAKKARKFTLPSSLLPN